MRFNTGQVQELARIKREQFRHWRKTLPQLEGRDGRSDQYTFGDILALATIGVLVQEMGMKISGLKTCASDIFALFAETEFAFLPKHIHITASGQLLVDEVPNATAYVSVNVARLLSEVQQRLTPDLREQLQLPLAL